MIRLPSFQLTKPCLLRIYFGYTQLTVSSSLHSCVMQKHAWCTTGTSDAKCWCHCRSWLSRPRCLNWGKSTEHVNPSTQTQSEAGTDCTDNYTVCTDNYTVCTDNYTVWWLTGHNASSHAKQPREPTTCWNRRRSHLIHKKHFPRQCLFPYSCRHPPHWFTRKHFLSPQTVFIYTYADPPPPTPLS